MKRFLLAMAIALAAFTQQPKIGANRGFPASNVPSGSGTIDINIAARNLLYASVSKQNGPMGDTVIKIDPATGAQQ
jgi:hypothetical protein